jgi:hypothetical protein
MKTAVKLRAEKGEIEYENRSGFEKRVPVSGDCSK